MTRCQGISKAGNSWARRVLIEIAWALAQLSADEPSLALVRGEDTGAIAPHPARHADCSGSQTCHPALALRRNRHRPRGRDHGEPRFLTEPRTETTIRASRRLAAKTG